MLKQKVIMGHLIPICLSLLSLVNAADTLADVVVTTLPKSSLVPGGIAVIPTDAEALSGHFKNQRITLANYNGEQYAIIGIPLNELVQTWPWSNSRQAGVYPWQTLVFQ